MTVSPRRVFTRSAALPLLVLGSLVLTACGGGPEALEDDAAAEKALLTDEEFPLDDWTRGTVTTGVVDAPSPAESDPQPSGDEDCVKAQEAFFSTVHSEYLSSSATAVYAQDVHNISLQVSGTTKEPDHLIKVTRGLVECGEIVGEQGGVEVTSRFERLDQDDVSGVRMVQQYGDSDEVELFMGGRTVGDNIVYAVGQDVSKDDFARVVNEQVEKLQD